MYLYEADVLVRAHWTQTSDPSAMGEVGNTDHHQLSIDEGLLRVWQNYEALTRHWSFARARSP
jgi:hypothetical protein